MQISTKRYVIAVALLSVTAFLTFGDYANQSYSGTLYTRDVPMTIGKWSGRELPMDESTYEILETRDAFSRDYVNPAGERAMLTVVFSQSNRKVSHPPEVCLSGGGWSRIERDIQHVAYGDRSLRVNRLVLQKGERKQVILYLYKAGEKLTPNYYHQQLNIVLNGMISKNVSSALIRVSCVVYNNDVEKATALAKRLTQEAMPILRERLP